MLTDVVSLWESLTAESKATGNYLERLVRPDAEVEIILGKGPDQCNLTISVLVTDDWKKGLKLPNCMDFRIRRDNSPSQLILGLRDSAYERIFIWFSQDLAIRLQTCTLNDASSILETALAEWSDAFRVQPDQGMGRVAQQGLFAELFYLDEIFCLENPEQEVLAWNSQNSIHDFQIEDRAWEVKSYGGRRPEVQISSEQQLETTGLEKLVLVVVSLKVSEAAGKSVQELVAHMTNRFEQNASKLMHLKMGLAKYGYIDESSVVTTYFFSPKTVSEFLVRDGFPRITSKDIPRAIHSVAYALSLGSLENYLAKPVLEF